MSTKRRTKIEKYPGIYRACTGKYEYAYRDETGRLRFKTSALVEGSDGKMRPDLQQAVAEREQMMGRKRRGEKVSPTRQTFADFAETWHAGLTVRPRTIERYRYALDAHLLPFFQGRKLAEVQTDDVARLVRTLGEASDDRPNGYSPATIAAALTCLSSVYRKAVRAGLVGANPVRGLEREERPQPADADRRILEEDEIARLLRTANRARPLVALLLFSGLRISEALGLSWEDIDFELGVIHVRKQLSRTTRERVPLKTKAARREVVLMPELATVLRELRMASRFKQSTDLVFTTPAGRGRDQRASSKSIERAVDRAKLTGQISAHTFRHGFASMLIVELRLDPVNVARQLGHSNPATTLRTYSHEFERARHASEIRDGLGEHFGYLLARSG